MKNIFFYKVQILVFQVLIIFIPSVTLPQLNNIAPEGTTYTWSQNINEFSDSNKVEVLELNDLNPNPVIWLNNGGDIPNAWEAAGVLWDTPQNNIKRVVYTHGPFDGETLSDGAFTRNFHIQITENGSIWRNIDIQPVPEYVYYTNTVGNEGAEVSNENFVFEGNFGTVLGVRVLGQVHTDNDEVWGSYVSTCRQIEVWSGLIPPKIVSHPQSQVKRIGEKALFNVKAESINLLSYQWYRNSSIISGAEDSVYQTKVLEENDNGNLYYCIVSDKDGSSISDTASLMIYSSSTENLILASNGYSYYHIYYGADEGEIVKHAALELGQWLDEITGAIFTVTTDESLIGKKIIVGRNNNLTSTISNEMNFETIHEDGFRILSYNNNLYISGNIARGTLYGVYHLLDAYFGLRWFSPEFEVVPYENTLVLSNSIDDLQNPHFQYREIFSGDTEDAYFRQHNKLNGNRIGTHREFLDYPAEINTWSKNGPTDVHNFYKIIPSNYHSGGQIMMMNDMVRSKAASYFSDRVSTEGDSFWYSFSQEDNGWSPDGASKSFANSHGGVLSAPIIDMVTNIAQKVRETNPNAHMGTLVYQWSFAPPTGMTIPEYVLVETAPIEANFGFSYNNSIKNAEIFNAYKGWAKISSSLGTWDYIANFQNYLQPLPTIYPMFQNIKYFAEIESFKTYFGQGAYNTVGAEFAELRAWVAARLLWNPNQSYEVLIDEFCDKYYGPASTYIKQYITLLHQSFINKGDRISSKQRITSDYLDLDFIMQAEQLLVAADAIATGEYSNHVHDVRLGVDMTILLREHTYKVEAAKRGIQWVYDSNRKNRFNQYCQNAGITNYSEDSEIDKLYAIMDIKRVNPSIPNIVDSLSEKDWIDFQDMDFSICCGANLVEDDKASDNGAVMHNNIEWAIQMKFDMLPAGEDWKLYAYVRVDPKSGGSPSGIAFKMGVWPGSTKRVKLSEVNDGEYHMFEFPGNPHHYETGKSLWFSAGSEVINIYVDRVIAKKKNITKINNQKNKAISFELLQNYPNPFNPTTTIKFSIPQNKKVTLEIFDMIGRKVDILKSNETMQRGWHSIEWNGKNLYGQKVSSGIYFYRLTAGKNTKIHKLLLLK